MNPPIRSFVAAAVLVVVCSTGAHAQLVDNGDGTVTDTHTSLMWVQEVESVLRQWPEANTWAEDLVFAGFDDWRLPTRDEMVDLFDRGLGGTVGSVLTDPGPFIFQGGLADPYWIWSSTPGSIPVTRKLGVNFATGEVEELVGGSDLRRWAVRSAVPPVIDDGDGIADDVDTDTGQFSNAFANGATTGSITHRGDQDLTVTATNGGVRIEAAPGGGAEPAVIIACDGTVELELEAGDGVTVTCTSAAVVAVGGDTDVTFLADGWPQARLTLPDGHGINFDDATLTLTAYVANAQTLTIVTETGDIALAPGASETIDKCPDCVEIIWVVVMVVVFVVVLIIVYAFRRRF